MFIVSIECMIVMVRPRAASISLLFIRVCFVVCIYVRNACVPAIAKHFVFGFCFCGGYAQHTLHAFDDDQNRSTACHVLFFYDFSDSTKPSTNTIENREHQEYHKIIYNDRETIPANCGRIQFGHDLPVYHLPSPFSCTLEYTNKTRHPP